MSVPHAKGFHGSRRIPEAPIHPKELPPLMGSEALIVLIAVATIATLAIQITILGRHGEVLDRVKALQREVREKRRLADTAAENSRVSARGVAASFREVVTRHAAGLCHYSGRREH